MELARLSLSEIEIGLANPQTHYRKRAGREEKGTITNKRDEEKNKTKNQKKAL